VHNTNRLPEGRTIPHAANAPSFILQVEDLNFSYPQLPLFTGWSARVPPGVTLLKGGDGRGKTTLLKLLAGVLPAVSGQLQIGSTDLARYPATYRQQLFWADPRSEAHDAWRPAAYFETLPGLYPDFSLEILTSLVDGFSLSPHLDKPLYMLSTGSKRKVWLAAAFASGATVTLLDEPLAALDTASIAVVLSFLDDAANVPSRAWIVASHGTLEGIPLAGVIDLGE
jgi:ABC-type multidrug transport system ATPase subunit